MPDPADPSRPRQRSIMPIALMLIVALLVGMGGMAWIVHRYDNVAEVIRPAPPPPALPAASERGATPVSIASVSPRGGGELAADERIDQLEDKLRDVDARAQTATSEAHHAEGLLVAFAARRAIDRGVPLGYLETVLRDRFGGVEPQSVATVISAARQPVTIGQLRDHLDAIEPQLAMPSTDESWWDGVRRELTGLIVIRRTTTPSTAPVDRLARARNDLILGHVDAALIEVARLPGRKAAEGWIVEARRYVQARVALDRIESAALLAPAKGAETAGPR